MKEENLNWKGRGFCWEDVDKYHAILHGPEPYEIAAVVELVAAAEECENGEWRVMSSTYAALNMLEPDAGISMESMKRRAVIALGQDLRNRMEKLQEEHISVLTLLHEREEDDPYEWPEL